MGGARVVFLFSAVGWHRVGGCPAAHINHVGHFYINSQNRIQITLADTRRPRPNNMGTFRFSHERGCSKLWRIFIHTMRLLCFITMRSLRNFTHKDILGEYFLRYYFIFIVVEHSGNVIIATGLRMIFRVKENDGVLVKRCCENETFEEHQRKIGLYKKYCINSS